MRARRVRRADVAGVVHEARTRIKKARGLLRLARRGLGRRRFGRENGFFRDAGREIRAVRDAAALVEALDGLSERCFTEKRPAIVTELRRLLARDEDRLARGGASEEAFARTARMLGEELKRVEAWKLEGFTWKDARRARRRGGKACRKAYEAALAEPADENLHEWRKRAKDLWYEMTLLRKGSPEARERIAEIETLTKILGEDHDLAMLAKAAAVREEELESRDQMELLMGALSGRRKELREEAFALARRWYGKI
jgi:CHAD domain-containing protein